MIDLIIASSINYIKTLKLNENTCYCFSLIAMIRDCLMKKRVAKQRTLSYTHGLLNKGFQCKVHWISLETNCSRIKNRLASFESNNNEFETRIRELRKALLPQFSSFLYAYKILVIILNIKTKNRR